MNQGIDHKDLPGASNAYVEEVELIAHLVGVDLLWVKDVREVFLQLHYIPLQPFGPVGGTDNNIGLIDVVC
nr:hypothetical protein [Pseudomonas aeruginosa]